MNKNPNSIIRKEARPTVPSYPSALPQLSRTSLTNKSQMTIFDQQNEHFIVFYAFIYALRYQKTNDLFIYLYCKICLIDCIKRPHMRIIAPKYFNCL